MPGVVDSVVSYDQCYQRSQEQIRKAIPLAQELGVKIANEDVWNDFLLSPLEAARYVDEFNNPAAVHLTTARRVRQCVYHPARNGIRP